MAAETDRRIDIVNELNMRVTILEAAHNEVVRARMHYDTVIESLTKDDNKMVLELQLISSKFDALLKQFALGFKLLSVAAVVVVTVIGAFWTYSNMLDAKYAKRSEVVDKAILGTANVLQQQKSVLNDLNKSVDAAQDTAQQQQDTVQSVVQDVQRIKKLKAIQASKPGR
jgi:hypothetical protein